VFGNIREDLIKNHKKYIGHHREDLYEPKMFRAHRSLYKGGRLLPTSTAVPYGEKTRIQRPC
jgi:hypothetical protein